MRSWLKGMRQGAGLLMTVLFAMAIIGEAALAFPQYSQTTGKPCTSCHMNPQGGKELTAPGQFYAKNRTLKGYGEAKASGKKAAKTAKPKAKTSQKKSTCVKKGAAKKSR